MTSRPYFKERRKKDETLDVFLDEFLDETNKFWLVLGECTFCAFQPVCMTVPRKVDRRLRSKNLRPVEDCGRRFFVRSKNLRPPVEESSTAVFECNLRYLFERSYRRERYEKTWGHCKLPQQLSSSWTSSRPQIFQTEQGASRTSLFEDADRN